MDKIVVMLILLIVVTFVSTMFIMWGWSLFMVPVFGMESLTFWQAFGFSLLAACFKGGTGHSKEALEKILK